MTHKVFKQNASLFLPDGRSPALTFPLINQSRTDPATKRAGHRTRVHPTTGLPFLLELMSRPEGLPHRPRLPPPPLERETSSNPVTAPPCQSDSFPLSSSTPIPSDPFQPSLTAGRTSATSTVRRRKQEQVRILDQSRPKSPGCFPPPIDDASAALPRRLPTVSSQGKRAKK